MSCVIISYFYPSFFFSFFWGGGEGGIEVGFDGGRLLDKILSAKAVSAT